MEKLDDWEVVDSATAPSQSPTSGNQSQVDRDINADEPPFEHPNTPKIIQELGYLGNPDDLPRSFHLAVNNRFTQDDLVKFKQDAELNFTHALPYFFSGSFIFPACLRSAINGTTLLSVAQSMTPAVLSGYNRFAVKNAPYPAMLPSTDSDDRVTGILVFGLLKSQRKAVHAFENGMFDLKRAPVELELQNGEKIVIEAGIYVWNGSVDSLEDKKWKDWRVEDLMRSEWFRRIISRVEDEERELPGFKKKRGMMWFDASIRTKGTETKFKFDLFPGRGGY